MAESKEEKKGDRPLEPAEVAKLEAEAKKALAEAEAATVKAKAEAAKFHAEAALFNADARSGIANAESMELKLIPARHEADRAAEKRRKELAADEHHHIYRFVGPVSNESVEKCLTQLNLWRRMDDEVSPIEIVFFSPGGSVLPGMALLDDLIAMREEGWHITTRTRGYAASMGGILLQAGDVRTCGPESYILIHEISSGAVGKIGELEDEVEFVKLIQKRVNDLFVSRSGGKVTATKLRAMYTRKDFWLDSKKALELGIVDEIS